MRKGLLLAISGLLAVLALHTSGVSADPSVRVLENYHTVRFAERMAFRLVAEHDETIKGVTLYYRRQREPVTTRVIPEFTPGRRVEATFEKSLQRGEIPPGTVMEYYWRLDLGNGQRVDVPPQVFVYEDDRFSWQALSGGKLTFMYYGGDRDRALAQDLLALAQSTLARLEGEVGVTVQDPVRVYLYHNATDMAGAIAPRSQGFDERILTVGEAIGDDTLLLLGSHPSLRQALAHELSHIVVGLATKNPYSPIPLWLNEGLAMYAEDELPAANAAALRDAIRRDALISVRSLSAMPGDPRQVDLYYGEVHSLVEFLLRTYGRDKMSQLLQVFRAGTHQEDALQQVYGLTIDELDAKWRESLGLKPRIAAAPAATRSPVAGPSRASVATAVPPTDRPSGRALPCPTPILVAGLAIIAACSRWRTGPA